MHSSPLALAQLDSMGADLLLSCPDCGASVVAPMAGLLRRFGPTATLADVRAPAVCGRCGCIDVDLRPLERGETC